MESFITKTKIIHIMHSLDVGGLENGVVNLVNNADPNIFEFVICCIKREGALKERLKGHVKVICLNEREGFNPFRIFKLAKIFLKEKPQIVHTHGWGSDYLSGVIAARMALVPKVVNGEHGVLYFEHKRRVIAQKILARMVSVTTTVSYELKDRLLPLLKINSNKIVPIINGVDNVRFSKNDEMGALKRKELDIDDDVLIIGTVGRLNPVKNYELLITSFGDVLEDNPTALLLFIGDGPIKKNLIDLSVSMGIDKSIKFLGSRDDIPGLMNVIDIFALTSVCEGLSNTILEAMACAKVVVATDVGDNSKLVDDGVTGFIVPSKDREALMRGIRRLVSDKPMAHKMGLAGRKKVEDEFALFKMVKNYEEFYMGLLK